MPYYIKDPKRGPSFDNYPYVSYSLLASVKAPGLVLQGTASCCLACAVTHWPANVYISRCISKVVNGNDFPNTQMLTF